MMYQERVRPSVFVGSSTEGHRIAQTIQLLLDKVCEVEIWSQGVFGLSQGTLESLVLALDKFDFAVLVLTADDLMISRGTERTVPRDNVLFELGLFVGGLGRDRTFIVFDRTAPPSLPTDLAGVTCATFEQHSSGNLEAALGAAATRIQSVIERLGIRESQKVQRLEKATETMEGTGSRMRELVRLLARSRKVELDIISAQFGPMIESTKLAQMKQDLRDLESMLDRDVLSAVSHEIAFNIKQIDRFLEIGYRVVDDRVVGAEGTPEDLRAITCLTAAFDSVTVQAILSRAEQNLRQQLDEVYIGFHEINERANALKQVFRPWRVSHYIDALQRFQEGLRRTAEVLIGMLE